MTDGALFSVVWPGKTELRLLIVSNDLKWFPSKSCRPKGAPQVPGGPGLWVWRPARPCQQPDTDSRRGQQMPGAEGARSVGEGWAGCRGSSLGPGIGLQGQPGRKWPGVAVDSDQPEEWDHSSRKLSAQSWGNPGGRGMPPFAPGRKAGGQQPEYG